MFAKREKDRFGNQTYATKAKRASHTKRQCKALLYFFVAASAA